MPDAQPRSGAAALLLCGQMEQQSPIEDTDGGYSVGNMESVAV